jgi:hypothetical protein
MLRIFENFAVSRGHTLTKEMRLSAKVLPVTWVSSLPRAEEAWLSTYLTDS